MSIELKNIKVPAAEYQPAKKKRKNTIGDLLNKDIQLFGGFSDKKKERFYSELSILFASGVDIRTALELIEESQEKNSDKKLFSGIKDEIVGGSTLSSAIEKCGKFSPYEYYSIKIGEESGRLPEVLEELAKYYSGRLKQKRQMINALSYPVIVLFTALGTIFFMLRFIVPMFKDVFKRFGGELPPITQFIVDLSEGMAGFGYYFLIAMVFITVFIATQKKKIWFRKTGSLIALKIPVLGSLIRKIYLARFCHSMNLLTGANTPLVESISLVGKMISFYPVERSLIKIKEMILSGSSLHQAMAKFPIYNKRMITLIKVAEEVNQLDTMFEKLAKQYSEEVEHQSGLVSSMLEPLLIIFVGLFVAVILIAMYLPLFNLSSTVG